MKKVFLFIVMTSLLASCVSKHRREMMKDLTNNDFKYWYGYYRNPSKPYAMGICVYKNGTFIRFENPNWDYAKRKINYNPVYSKTIWKFIDDSTIMLGKGIVYRILALTSDSLILGSIDLLDSNYLKYHRDSDQITKPE